MSRFVVFLTLLLLIPVSLCSASPLPPFMIVNLPSDKPLCPLVDLYYPAYATPDQVVEVTATAMNIGEEGKCTVEILSLSGKILAKNSQTLGFEEKLSTTYKFKMPNKPAVLVVRSYPFGNGSDQAYIIVAVKNNYLPQGVILGLDYSHDVAPQTNPIFTAQILNVGYAGKLSIYWDLNGKTVKNETVNLKNGENYNSTCQVPIPSLDKLNSTDLLLQVGVRNSQGITDLRNITLHVADRYPIPQILNVLAENMSVERQGSLKVVVKNIGNLSGLITVDLIYSPSWGPSYLFARKRANVSVGEERTFTFWLTPQPSYNFFGPTTLPLKIKAYSLPSVAEEREIVVNVSSAPLFVVEAFNSTTKAVIGKTVTIAADIANKGLEAGNVTFRVRNSSTYLYSQHLTISPNSGVVAYYSFVMPSYPLDLTVELLHDKKVFFQREVHIAPLKPEEAPPASCPWVHLYEWWPGQYLIYSQKAPPDHYVEVTFFVENPTKLSADISALILGGSLHAYGLIYCYEIPPHSRGQFNAVFKLPSSTSGYTLSIGQKCSETDPLKKTVTIYKMSNEACEIQTLHLFDLWNLPKPPSLKLFYPECTRSGAQEWKKAQSISFTITPDPNYPSPRVGITSITYPQTLRPGQEGTITVKTNSSGVIKVMRLLTLTSFGMTGSEYYKQGTNTLTYTFRMPNHDVSFFVGAGSNYLFSDWKFVTIKVDTSKPMFWIDKITYDRYVHPFHLYNVSLTVENKGTAGTATIVVGNVSKQVYLGEGEKKTINLSLEAPTHAFALPVRVLWGSEVHEEHYFNIITLGYILPKVSDLSYPPTALPNQKINISFFLRNTGNLTPGHIWYKLVDWKDGKVYAEGEYSTIDKTDYLVSVPIQMPSHSLSLRLYVGHEDPFENKTDFTKNFYIVLENKTYLAQGSFLYGFLHGKAYQPAHFTLSVGYSLPFWLIILVLLVFLFLIVAVLYLRSRHKSSLEKKVTR